MDVPAAQPFARGMTVVKIFGGVLEIIFLGELNPVTDSPYGNQVLGGETFNQSVGLLNVLTRVHGVLKSGAFNRCPPI
jgi:hypothetical protein